MTTRKPEPHWHRWERFVQSKRFPSPSVCAHTIDVAGSHETARTFCGMAPLWLSRDVYGTPKPPRVAHNGESSCWQCKMAMG